jgi:hypothetical protein
MSRFLRVFMMLAAFAPERNRWRAREVAVVFIILLARNPLLDL